MYFPYLYSRQAELNAISDIANSVGSPQRVFPIIEPVGPAPKLISALGDLSTKNAAAYVVTNPNQGKLANSTNSASWHHDFATTLANDRLVYPTFKETPTTTIWDVKNFVAAYPTRKIGIVIATSNISPSDISAALAGTDFTAFFMPSVSSAIYAAALGTNRTVEISDNFRSEARNKDYSGEEWLANNHTTWSQSGRAGFSDFTILPSAYRDGGGPVGAIAVHLTYLNGSDFWIQHFVSSTNAQNDPQATKFREVLRDIHSQVIMTPNRFENSPGLQSYMSQHTSGLYTNLSGNKRQQISHHIYSVAKLLGV